MIRHLPGPDKNPELKAVFKITYSFKITSRGFVFAGTIIEGELYSKDYLEFMAGNQLKRRMIKEVEMFRGPNIHYSKFIGLLIQCENEQEIDELQAMPLFNLIACVYDGN